MSVSIDKVSLPAQRGLLRGAADYIILASQLVADKYPRNLR
jgi:hypothetical protein